MAPHSLSSCFFGYPVPVHDLGAAGKEKYSVSKAQKKTGIKSISEFFADPLLFLLSIVSLSARYAPCHGIKFSPSASLLCVIPALRLLTSLIQRYILVHGHYLHIIFGCPPIISDGQPNVIIH